VIWGWAAYELEIPKGTHEFTLQFPMLPVKPGPYSWYVSLWDDDGLIDMCDLVPEMLVATESHQHPQDNWNGILNIPTRFEIKGKGDRDTASSFSPSGSLC
jgi:hypothetical protein